MVQDKELKIFLLKQLKKKMNIDARFYDDDLFGATYLSEDFKAGYYKKIAEAECKSICEYIKTIEDILKEVEDESTHES